MFAFYCVKKKKSPDKGSDNEEKTTSGLFIHK